MKIPYCNFFTQMDTNASRWCFFDKPVDNQSKFHALITVTSRERYGIPRHQSISIFLNRMLRLTIKKILKLQFIGHFVKVTRQWPANSHNKISVMRNTYPCEDVIINLFPTMRWEQRCWHLSVCRFMYIVSKICFISIAYASVNMVTNGSGNGLSPIRRQAITWTNAALSSIGLLGTSFNEIWIWFLSTPCKKIRWNCCLPKWRPFCLRLNVLRHPRDWNWNCIRCWTLHS